MAATTEDRPEQERNQSLWASFDRADTKLFVVTFAGTVAANVVTVMVIAIAVIIARPSVSGPSKTASNALWYVGLGVDAVQLSAVPDVLLAVEVRQSA